VQRDVLSRDDAFLIVWFLFVAVICNRYTINLKAKLRFHGSSLRSLHFQTFKLSNFFQPCKDGYSRIESPRIQYLSCNVSWRYVSPYIYALIGCDIILISEHIGLENILRQIRQDDTDKGILCFLKYVFCL